MEMPPMLYLWVMLGNALGGAARAAGHATGRFRGAAAGNDRTGFRSWCKGRQWMEQVRHGDGAAETYPARRKLWRVSICPWSSQIFVASSAEL